MACGLPVVVSDVGDNGRVAEGAGLVVRRAMPPPWPRPWPSSSPTRHYAAGPDSAAAACAFARFGAGGSMPGSPSSTTRCWRDRRRAAARRARARTSQELIDQPPRRSASSHRPDEPLLYLVYRIVRYAYFSVFRFVFATYYLVCLFSIRTAKGPAAGGLARNFRARPANRLLVHLRDQPRRRSRRTCSSPSVRFRNWGTT